MLPFIQFDVVQQESSHGSLIDQPQSFPEESTDGLGLIDYIAIPKRLDSQFELLDSEGSVRPTIIRPGPLWTKKSLPALLARPEIAELGADEQSVARKQAYDLLDALTKSGAVPVSCASLHVVVATTHCFDSSVLDTVICQNINPIERVELSNMIIATTVHGRSPVELVKTEQYGKLVLLSPDTPLLNK
ncbi:unnamed protein product [Symbiodinium microadriaticum]|nr:unnamed protein product [Symbiodinium microadriaticum]